MGAIFQLFIFVYFKDSILPYISKVIGNVWSCLYMQKCILCALSRFEKIAVSYNKIYVSGIKKEGYFGKYFREFRWEDT